MPRLRLISALLALAAIPLAGIGSLQAQSIPSPYRFIEERQEAGVFGGYFNADQGRFDLGPASGPMVGLRYGLELSGPIGLEGVTTLVPGTRDVINPARVEGDRKVDEAESALLLIEARLRFALTGRRTWNGLQPYVFAGGGIGFDAQGDQVEDSRLAEADRFSFGTQFVGSTGAGARWIVGSRWVVRVDAGLFLYQLDTPQGFLDPTRDLGVVPESEWVNSGTVSLGLAFRF